jgi:hypothetical protein
MEFEDAVLNCIVGVSWEHAFIRLLLRAWHG